MARDVVIRWKEKPTKKQIGYVLRDFFNGAATEIRWKKDRWFITLPGKPKKALGRVVDFDFPCRDDERWIEVWPDPKGKSLYLMTRMQDHYTNALVDGMAKLIAWWTKGIIDK